MEPEDISMHDIIMPAVEGESQMILVRVTCTSEYSKVPVCMLHADPVTCGNISDL